MFTVCVMGASASFTPLMYKLIQNCYFTRFVSKYAFNYFITFFDTLIKKQKSALETGKSNTFIHRHQKQKPNAPKVSTTFMGSISSMAGFN